MFLTAGKVFAALVCYFVLAELFDDMIQAARKRWRHYRYGEKDYEAENAGFRLRTTNPGIRRGIAGQGPPRLLKRSGSQLNPSEVTDPELGTRSIRERE